MFSLFVGPADELLAAAPDDEKPMPVPVKVAPDFFTVAERFGYPAAMTCIMWTLFAWQQRRAERRADETSKRLEDRQDAVFKHLTSMDERRARQLDAFVGIQEKQADNERVQAAAMTTSAQSLAALEQLTRKISGEGCGRKS